MNVFNIIGPVMVGPSSSHTAGALRIAKVVRTLMGEDIKAAVIKFHGSFAATYKGHGTDKAVIGGLLGFDVDDVRIRNSLTYAFKAGLTFSIQAAFLGDVHPNTVHIDSVGFSGRKISVTGASVGGGNIVIKQIHNINVEFTGKFYTLIIEHTDRAGMVAKITSILGQKGVNIAGMRLYRSEVGGLAIAIIETDQKVEDDIIAEVRSQADVLNATGISAL